MDDRHRLWQRAASFAARAHRHETRKDGNTPYVAHVVRVALTIRHVFEVDDDVILAAALLHDVIEDTPADYDDVLEEFGQEVADIVALMTKDMRLVEPERERQYDAQLVAGTWKARLVKLADVYDNLTDAMAGGDARAIRRVAAKAQRAVALTGTDSNLEKPARIVSELIEQALT